MRFGLYPVLQSAYRQGHSTETALLKVQNDILLNMDMKRITLLVFLDLSAAFDTVDRKILISRLKSSLGIRGNVLNLFSSYLANRSQCVSVDGFVSNSFPLPQGVPQGSCLGPLLFTIYASKMFQIIRNHLPDVHACMEVIPSKWWVIRAFSIIAQVIIEKGVHWLVEDYVISCYNHPMRGDYNTEAQIFKMATARFLMFLERKKKENAFALIITWAIIPINNHSSQAQRILWNNPYSTIFTSPSANNC